MKSKRIKLLFVIANAQFSGAERQLLLLAKHLNKNRFIAEVCCLEGEGTFTEAVRKAELPLHIFHRERSFDLKRLFSLVKLIRKEKYQIVHSFTWSANQYARLARLFVKFKLVSGERGRDLVPINMENIIDRILSSISHHIVFNSNIQLQKYLRGKNLKNKSVSVIFNGIDFEQFQNKGQNILRSLLDVNVKTMLIGTIGNFTAHKNFRMFIEVCEKLIKQNSDIHFVAIGEGKEKNYFADLIKHKGLKNRLTLTGRIKNIEKVIPSLDLLLLTSTWEGMPNVILESMASEVPVISTNVDGCNEIIQDGVNGFSVDSNDVDSMVSKISLLLVNSALRQKVIQNGLLTIQSKFSLEKMVNAYESLYVSL